MTAARIPVGRWPAKHPFIPKKPGRGNGPSKHRMVYTVSPTATVSAAVDTMVSRLIGSVLVMEHELPVGIFTERDALTRVLHAHRDPGRRRSARS